MLKARGTASVWLVNLSLYQTADQMVFFARFTFMSLLLKLISSNQVPYASNKMHRFQWLLFFSYHCATTISLFILQTHKIPGKGRTNTRSQHMKPYTLSSQFSNGSHCSQMAVNAFIRQTKHKHGHCYKTKLSPYLVIYVLQIKT